MALAQQQKSFENPFQRCTEENDVVVKVGGETLHLKSSILSFCSPVLKEVIENQQSERKEISIAEKKLESVETFFMFFYPEFQVKFLHEQLLLSNCETIKEILSLSEEYKLNWIQSHIDYVLSSPKYIAKFTNTSEETLEMLMVANEYKLDNMVRNITTKIPSYIRDMLLYEKDFQNLSVETKIAIAISFPLSLSTNMFGTGDNFCYMIRDIVQEVTGTNLLQDKNNVENKNNSFGIKEHSDVIVKVEDQTLYLHSTILCHCSPVFKAMLTGNFKEASTREIVLKDKKAEHVITLFGLCYPDKPEMLTAKTNYEEILSFCQEYQMDWLKNIIEQHLIDSKMFTENYRNVKNSFDGLFLTDKFNLNDLRNAICHDSNRLICFYDDKVNFGKLSKISKYQLLRKELKVRNIQEEVLKLFDSCINY